MSLLKNRWLWASLLGVLVSGGLLLVTVGYVGLIVISGLANGTPMVDVLLDIAVPTLVAIAVLFVALVVSGIGLVVVLLRSSSVPRSERMAAMAGRLEREYPPLRAVGLSEVLEPAEPSAEERAERALAELKWQYVDGEISEAEFERKVDRLVANESIDEVRAARERNQVLEDEPGR